MNVINTKFKDLKVIQQKKHGDIRGNLRETFVKKIIKGGKRTRKHFKHTNRLTVKKY